MSPRKKRTSLIVAMLIGLMTALSIAPTAQAATAAPSISEVASDPAIIKVTAVNGTVQGGFVRSLLTSQRTVMSKSGNTLEFKATVAGEWRVTALVKDATGNIHSLNLDAVAVPRGVADIVDASVGSDTIDMFWSKTTGVQGRTVVFDRQSGPGDVSMDVSALSDGDGASFTVTASGVWCVSVISRYGTEYSTSASDCAYFNAS